MSGTSIEAIEAPDRAAAREIEYPEGPVMPQHVFHDRAAGDFKEALQRHFRLRGEKALVARGLRMYYEEGNSEAHVQPDLLVVRGLSAAENLHAYLIWDHGKPPELIVEVASRSTVEIDATERFDLYAQLGVQEYWQVDPQGTLMDPPPIRGWRLDAGGTYGPVLQLADEDGIMHYWSAILGMRLRAGRQQGAIVMVLQDVQTGEDILTGPRIDKALRDKHARLVAAMERPVTAKQARIESENALRAAEERRLAAEKRLRWTEALVAKWEREIAS